MQRMRLLVSSRALLRFADRARDTSRMGVEGRQATLVDNAIEREAAGRTFETSCAPIHGQVFNNVSLVRTSRLSEPGERAMDHVAFVESQ